MLKNIPIADRFKEESFLYAGNAFQMLGSIVFELDQLNSKELLEDLNEEEVDYFQSALQTKFRNVVVVAVQAYELRIRGLVAELSPLLLLGNYRDWVTKAEKQDVEFLELGTASISELASLLVATGNNNLNSNFFSDFRNLRILRNEIIHGLPKKAVEPHQLVRQIAELLITYGHESLMDAVLDHESNSHLGILSDGFIKINPYEEQQLVLMKFSGYFKHTFICDLFFDSKITKIHCPVCIEELSEDYFSKEDVVPTVSEEDQKHTCHFCDAVCQVEESDDALYITAEKDEKTFCVEQSLNGELWGNVE